MVLRTATKDENVPSARTLIMQLLAVEAELRWDRGRGRSEVLENAPSEGVGRDSTGISGALDGITPHKRYDSIWSDPAVTRRVIIEERRDRSRRVVGCGGEFIRQ